MKKVAVIFADGCEEMEGLSQVDVLRRLGVPTDMIGLTKLQVHGDHDINITCDKILDDSLLDYDLVSFPGGKPGAEALRDNSQLAQLMKKRHQLGKWNAAMCAAPIALSRYGLLNDTDYTCYPGFEKEIGKECPTGRFHEDIVVTDSKQKIITSRGPATAWAFSYALAQALGIETKTLEDGMLYTYLKDNI
ncbi:DJ-1/PfpI family protein [Lactobacillus mulieris]|uniref:DJ-1 family glyoxalase III n=1 Tax=Lactobacillus mulieris TaxID=2508708 RepID=UPI0022CDF1E6|nr:DJ-1 family glyoxalase III [Lactobacillus mulieris]MCZ9599690.1 DJ-1/PfpI family protein [Lactobacillus mulieris]